jgi:hypothetical protein
MESNPKMLGVRILLFVTVWKITVENAIAQPTTMMATIFMTLLGSA